MEVLGSPEEHVEKAAKGLIDALKERKDLEILKVYTSKTKEAEIPENKSKIKFFSCFNEVEVRLDNIEKIVGFCFDFMPSSIDILEPSKLEMDAKDVNGFVNDLMARLHRYDMFLKNLKAHAGMMKKELDEMKNKD